MNELYSVHSLIRGFAYEGTTYEEVKVAWFVAGRAAPLVPFEQAIQDCTRLSASERAFPEGYVREFFGREEAQALKAYLDRRRELTTFIEPVELPVMANASGCRRLPRGHGADFLALHREKGYSLPFKVEGYFSVRLAAPRVQGDDRRTEIAARAAKKSSDK
ncbi:MAG TPA: hypothetical protein PK919_02495 [Candidatus Aminicenantes bacterium]|nr:hypothetical protein [Candidatus Aminicenantes bacterium]